MPRPRRDPGGVVAGPQGEGCARPEPKFLDATDAITDKEGEETHGRVRRRVWVKTQDRVTKRRTISKEQGVELRGKEAKNYKLLDLRKAAESMMAGVNFVDDGFLDMTDQRSIAKRLRFRGS